MPHYKDEQNQVYWFDTDEQQQTYLPGLDAITDEEADELRQSPPPTQEQINAARIVEIDAELDALDRASIRPLRAIADGTATDEDRARLTNANATADALREERRGL
ncbi:hypothetical protein FACS1894205_3220 [Alphaproteobacteria bacterium]|nr:hypothetical protein FACS1894205_3220 [Alphaproteobacteria bacterium]